MIVPVFRTRPGAQTNWVSALIFVLSTAFLIFVLLAGCEQHGTPPLHGDADNGDMGMMQADGGGGGGGGSPDLSPDLGGPEPAPDAGMESKPDGPPLVCGPPAACNPFAPNGGCPGGAGYGCFKEIGTGKLYCALSGGKDVGEACDYAAPETCRNGLACVNRTCRPFCCRSSSALPICPAGMVCYPAYWVADGGVGVDDPDFGWCGPLPDGGTG